MAKVLVFDINGTLLDTRALAPLLQESFGSRYSLESFFDQLIQYTMAITLAGDYRDFGDIAVSVLMMAAAAHRVSFDREDQDRFRKRMRELPPYPEVKRSLGRLRDAGYTLVALSNSGQSSLEAQLRYAGIASLFHHRISVETAGRFKPAPECYRLVTARLGVAPQDVMMVAAHPWDLYGAAHVGFKTAFLSRPGKAQFPGAPVVDYTAPDLGSLTNLLLGERSSPSQSKTGKVIGAAVGLLAVGAAALLQRKPDRE